MSENRTPIRVLGVVERPLLEAHFLRLPPDDRGLRFGGAALPDRQVRRYCAAIDWRRSANLGLFEDGALRGVAQLVYTGAESPLKPAIATLQAMGGGAMHGSTAAEFAISVERPWRRLGNGERLLRRLVTVARNRNVNDLFMYCRADNLPMRRLARKIGINLVFNGGEMEGHRNLPPPDALTVYAEIASAAAGMMDDAHSFWATAAG